MVEVRACVYVSVIFLCFHIVTGTPMFGLLYCDLFCEDDDPATTTTSTSTEDPWDVILCSGCGPRLPPVTTPAPGPAGPMPSPWSIMIPPSPNAMNLTLYNNPGSNGWFMNMMPWSQGVATPAPPGPTAAASAPAAVTAAAPAAVTAATTAAAAPTTAAPAA